MKIIDLINLLKFYEFDDKCNFSTKKIFDKGNYKFITYNFTNREEKDIYINKLSSNVITIFNSFMNIFFKKNISKYNIFNKYDVFSFNCNIFTIYIYYNNEFKIYINS